MLLKSLSSHWRLLMRGLRTKRVIPLSLDWLHYFRLRLWGQRLHPRRVLERDNICLRLDLHLAMLSITINHYWLTFTFYLQDWIYPCGKHRFSTILCRDEHCCWRFSEWSFFLYDWNGEIKRSLGLLPNVCDLGVFNLGKISLLTSISNSGLEARTCSCHTIFLLHNHRMSSIF